MEVIQRQKCCYCKMNLTIENFKKKRDDSYQKTCNQCLANRAAYAKKSKCEHDKERSRCKECGGVGVCEHNTRRNRCKLCSDPLKITIKHMISSSKQKDKKHDRYDIVNFVDYGFVENLIDDYTHCCYPDCNKELQIVHYQDDLATIERLDNSIGHIKSNCVICCLKCNAMRKSDRQ